MSKWAWDGLPYYCTDNWFMLDGRSAYSELKADDWFMVIRIFADDCFDPKAVRKSDAFSGPDPLSMPAAEEASSSIYVYLYHVLGNASVASRPDDIWSADPDAEVKTEQWSEIEGVPSSRIFWREALGDVFAEGGTESLIQKVRASLTSRGILPT